MNRSTTRSISLLAGLFFSTAAWPITFTVNDNLGAQYVGHGGSVAGQFDINSVLSAPEFNRPYDITSAVFSFSFSDDGDTPVYESGPTLGAYQFWSGPHANGPYTYYNYWRGNQTTYRDEAEAVTVTVEGQSANGATDSFDDYAYHALHFDTSYWLTQFTVYRQDWTQDVTHTTGHRGDIVITAALTGAALDALATDGIAGFNIASSVGDFNFNSATLTVTATENPLLSASGQGGASGGGSGGGLAGNTATASGPPTLAVAAFGLLTLVGAQRRR